MEVSPRHIYNLILDGYNYGGSTCRRYLWNKSEWLVEFLSGGYIDEMGRLVLHYIKDFD